MKNQKQLISLHLKSDESFRVNRIESSGLESPVKLRSYWSPLWNFTTSFGITNTSYICQSRPTSKLTLANLFSSFEILEVNLPAVLYKLLLINDDIQTALFFDRLNESSNETIRIDCVMLNIKISILQISIHSS